MLYRQQQRGILFQSSAYNLKGRDEDFVVFDGRRQSDTFLMCEGTPIDLFDRKSNNLG